MNKIKSKDIKRHNYKSSEKEVAVYNELDFDGGLIEEMSLSEKSDFFSSCKRIK